MTTAAPENPRRPSPLVAFAGDIKLSHSIFAMPFALLSMFLAANARGLATDSSRLPHLGEVGLILACMVIARSFAMGMNRLLDAHLDAANARTARRAIPAGRLSIAAAKGILFACVVAFELVTLGFFLFYNNVWPALLALPLLAILGAYPLFKRFTRWCHFYLGFCLALAPVCAWIAIAATADLTPWLLAAAVLFWTGGFDIIYATQDFDSDRATGTFSLPAAIGIGPALWVARFAHATAVTLLVLLGIHSPALDLLWFIAVGIVACVFVVEHTIVKPHDLSRVNLAFFTLNGIVALCLGTLGIADAVFF
jgi:4-hydroxybenzoate polyprenyltransferase